MSKGADQGDRRRQTLAGAYSAVTVNSSACGSTSYLVIDQKTQAVVVARRQAVMVPCCHVAKLMSEKNERAPRGLSDSSESIQSLLFWGF
jgi:hypothetical protein